MVFCIGGAVVPNILILGWFLSWAPGFWYPAFQKHIGTLAMRFTILDGARAHFATFRCFTTFLIYANA